MRSKWLWAALALVAVLGITTAASATTRGLITGSMIAAHSINSKKLVDHTIQKHDLSSKLIRSLRGAKGATGPAGPRGATGATGAQGPTGVVDTKAFAGPVPDEVKAPPVEPAWTVVGPTVTVTTTSTQKLVGSAVAVFGSTLGTEFWFGLCYQPASGLTEPINGFMGWDVTKADATANSLPYAAAGSVTPGAGTWEIGYCVNNLGSNSLDNNGSVNGWVQVVN